MALILPYSHPPTTVDLKTNSPQTGENQQPGSYPRGAEKGKSSFTTASSEDCSLFDMSGGFLEDPTTKTILRAYTVQEKKKAFSPKASVKNNCKQLYHVIADWGRG